MNAPERGDDGTQPVVRAARGRRTAVAATLAVAALALAAGLAATLSQAGVRLAGSNDVIVKGVVDRVSDGRRICQSERVPAGTAAIALSVSPAGRSLPPLAVEAIDAARREAVATAQITSTTQGVATAPLRPSVVRERGVLLCVELAAAQAPGGALLLGAPAEERVGATRNGKPLGGRFRVSYLHADAQSWWAFAPTVFTRMGRAGVWSGPVIPLLAGLLVLSSIALASWLLVRQS